MATKAIIFDLWNTIAYNKGAKVNPIVKLEELLGLNIGLYREVELGFMTKRFKTRREAMVSLCKHVGVKPTDRIIDTLVYVWGNLQINITLFPDVVPVINELRKKYKVGLLSNTDCFTIEEFKEKGHDKLFDSMAFSCNLGLLKPDPKIFWLVLHELGAKPEETVMVGDNYKDDILAAEKLGIRGVLLKRDYDKYVTKPSHIETKNHTRTITELSELEKFL
jgi:putative hydrolase of the HAD superfamily